MVQRCVGAALRAWGEEVQSSTWLRCIAVCFFCAPLGAWQLLHGRGTQAGALCLLLLLEFLMLFLLSYTLIWRETPLSAALLFWRENKMITARGELGGWC